ncbi:uncharacterized protein METZ01_LOCUS412545 [marine metagenome]|uniref:Uncharacterized protein n=1 Tax=marine metagenome TaxID=408172 RepID=A0A382WNQ0_9ZZZZ
MITDKHNIKSLRSQNWRNYSKRSKLLRNILLFAFLIIIIYNF